MTQQIFVAARVWGKFQWPPMPGQASYEPAHGVVQVEYIKQPTNYKARVVWIPQATALAALGQSTDLDKLSINTSKPEHKIQSVSDFSKPQYQDKMLEIDAATVTGFAFVGGTFFEIFKLKKDGSLEATLGARLPIATDGRASPVPIISNVRIPGANSELLLRAQLPSLTSGDDSSVHWDRAIWSAGFAYQKQVPSGPSWQTSEISVRPREHVTGIFSLLGEPVPSLPGTYNLYHKLRLDLSESTARFRLEALQASWLTSSRGVLRAKVGNGWSFLQIAFERQDTSSLHTESLQFGLSVTANWTITKEQLARCLTPNGGAYKIEASVFPEVYWADTTQQPDADDDLEGLEVLWEALQQSLIARDHLKTTSGGLATSFLPSRVSHLPARCELALGYKSVSFEYEPGTQISESLKNNTDVKQASPQCLSFLSDVKSISSTTSNSKDLAVDFENQLGVRKQATLTLSHLLPESTFFNDPASRPIMSFGLRLKADHSTAETADFESTLGGLTLVHPHNFLIFDPRTGQEIEPTLAGQVVIGLPTGEGRLAPKPESGVPRLSVFWEFKIAVKGVRANRVDVPWGDREVRQLPLIIPVNQAKVESPFVLRVRESISPRQDRHLVCDLFENNTESRDVNETYMLLSRDPWSIVRFSRKQFSSSGDQENAIIATYDSDNRVWRYKLLAPEYRFQFPPQVIGESADKPRRLELHDINSIGPDGNRLREADIKTVGAMVEYIRPAPVDPTTRRSYVVENALTPSLDLWVKPTDLERNYVMAEWNAYELFRQRNDFGIGVALRAMRGEFLYGLMFAIETALEKSQNSLARISEIEAIMGVLPQRSYKTLNSNRDDTTADIEKKLSERWLTVRAALLSRQERLEVWTPAYNQARPFAPARFETGARFALRSTALFRSPTEHEGLELTSPESLRVKKDQGLSGGAIWPIEFQSFWKALQDRPQAVGGSIENIAIGPTGGDAIQSAKFLDGLVTIASETRAGFVHRQRVEILGRIGAFWNRAKHVVIYERTVNPSEQFAPEPVDDVDQDTWRFSRSRRAVLRKVSEYIEILEPTRCYPDEPTGTPKQTGFLDSVRFGTKIIFVDSAWGRDVKQGNVEGYEIPLWNLRAARMRPNVYAMPEMDFVTVGEGREERPLVPRQCANPDNLYFFAQSSTREGDTNKWAPVFTIDYSNLIDATYCETHTAMGGAGHGAYEVDGIPQGRKPSPPRVLPGHQRFTWRLLPSSEKTLINAEYGNKPVFGELETITFSRGVPVKPASDTASLTLKEHIEKDSSAIAQISQVQDFIQRNLADIQALGISDAATELTPEQKKEVGRIQAEIESIQKVANEAGERISGAVGRSAAVLKDLQILEAPDKKMICASLKQQVAETANRKRVLIAEAIGGWQEELESFVDSIDTGSIQAAFEAARGNLTSARQIFAKAVGALFEEFTPLNELLGNVQNKAEQLKGDVEVAQRILGDSVSDIDSILLLAEKRISALFESAERELDWGVERYNRYRSQFNSEVAGLQTELSRAQAEISSRAGAELSSLLPVLSKKLVDDVGPLLKSVSESLRKSELILPVSVPGSNVIATEVEETKKRLVTAIRAARSSFAQEAQDLIVSLATAGTTTLDEATNHLQTFSNEVLRAQFLGRSVLQLIEQSLFERIENEIAQGSKLTDATARQLKEQIRSRIKDIGGTIRDSIPLNVILEGFPNEIGAACEKFKDLATEQFKNYVPKDLLDGAKDLLGEAVKLYTKFLDAGLTIGAIKDAIKDIKREAGNIRDSLSKTAADGQAYSNRVIEGFSRLGSGGIGAAPSNVLKIISAATASPELGQMQANADRMRCAYEDTKLATTKLRATFGKLGDALKALGIDVPFEGLADELTLPDKLIKKYDISQLFPNFGGLDLKGLLPDVKVPDGVKDTVKLSHDFDKKQFRAWVQIDVNMPVKGKKELFAIGPFAVSFRDTLLTALLRAEASKDTEQVSTTAKSEIATHIDVEIGGERMLSLEDVAIRYNKESGIDFKFDPKKIKLQQSLQFVQDTLGQIFGDEIGGMKLIKQNGIPIGVSHEYSLPNISFMGGTSGISNIQIANSFKLLAYPDFVISNRFNLSKAELPFLFSFFIVGGSGYVYVDASYRPFDQTLIVEVEASAGGSAALGFSFGPVQGSVFVSFSLVITYRKTLSGGTATGDGLAVSTQLVIAGNVSLYGMVDVYMGILLRMQYGEGGKIDGKGRIDLKVKISRFITLKYSSEMTMKLRNGRTETTRVTRTSAEPGERFIELEKRAKQLRGARS